MLVGWSQKNSHRLPVFENLETLSLYTIKRNWEEESVSFGKGVLQTATGNKRCKQNNYRYHLKVHWK